MAVTIHTTPESFTPSDNPLIWTFSSNQTAQDNFSFIVQVFINNVQVGEESVFLESGIYGKYDASHYASNACALPTISSDIVYAANNNCLVKITVIENYGTPPTNQASATSSNVVAWKAKLSDVDYAAWDTADYIYGTNAKFLTNFPVNTYNPKVDLTGEQIRLMLFNNLNNIALTIKLYEADGTLIVSGNYNATVNTLYVICVNVTPEVIVNESIGITLANFEAAAYYTIEDTTDVAAFRIDIDTDHKYSTAKRLHFISRIGSVEAFSFNLISRESSSIQSSSYTRIRGEWNSSSWAYVKSRGSKIGYAKTQDKKMTVESDWLYEDIQHWLMDNLYYSPVVLEQDTDGTLIRREIMNTSYDKGIQENDMLLNCIVEISQDSETSFIA